MGNMEFGGASEDSESKRTWSRGECLQSSGLVGVDGNGLCRPGCGRAGRPQGRAGHSQYLPGVPGTRLKVSEQVSRPGAAPALGPTVQGSNPGAQSLALRLPSLWPSARPRCGGAERSDAAAAVSQVPPLRLDSRLLKLRDRYRDARLSLRKTGENFTLGSFVLGLRLMAPQLP